VAGIAALAPDTRAAVRCYAKTPKGPCDGEPLRAIIQGQKALWLIALCGIFFACTYVLGTPLAGVAGCVLVIATDVPAETARRLITESLCFSAFFCFAALAALAHLRARWWLWLVAGGVLGLAVLVRPSFQILVPATATLVVLACVFGRAAPWRAALAAGVLVLVGSVVVLSPWLARNAVVTGELTVSASYGSNILLERLAYNAMTWGEWAAAFVYWLPDFGDDLAVSLFGADTVARLSFGAPDAFFNTDPDLPPPPAGQSPFAHYLRVGVLHNLADHVLVSLPLMVRGARVGDYLFLAAVFLILPAISYMRATGRLWTFALVAGPPVMMLAVHALLSVSVPRYNLALVLVYALTVLAAGLQARCWLRVRTRGRSVDAGCPE
jgi:hypothetical protein